MVVAGASAPLPETDALTGVQRMGKIMTIAAAGLSTGNFLYQLMFEVPQWDVAFERSYFQCLAVIGVYLVLRLKKA
jgi:hypothetical protein